jgi:hypothetical protein
MILHKKVFWGKKYYLLTSHELTRLFVCVNISVGNDYYQHVMFAVPFHPQNSCGRTLSVDL